MVWSKEEAPASLVCKLAMSATTKNNGAFADFLDKRKGKGKGNLVMKSTPSRVGWSRPDVVLVALWPGSRSMCAF